jgi:XRE family transcriptional regulator, regulator of sulfur utilization
MSELRHAFGLAVRIFRERQGWSQARLAEAAGLDRGYVSRIETGIVDPGLDMQRRLADALGINLSELITQAEEEEQRRRRRAERSAREHA